MIFYWCPTGLCHEAEVTIDCDDIIKKIIESIVSLACWQVYYVIKYQINVILTLPQEPILEVAEYSISYLINCFLRNFRICCIFGSYSYVLYVDRFLRTERSKLTGGLAKTYTTDIFYHHFSARAERVQLTRS